MIDIATETILSLTEAAGLLPRRRAGKKPNLATLYRWTTAGCKGTLLECVQVGGTRCTSREALQRFVERLSAACGPQSAIQLRTPARRRREHERAVQELERAGV